MDIIKVFGENLRIFKRMKYLKSTLTFPITDEKEKVYNSVLDLPIACKGTNYTQRCKSEDIAKVGKKIFKDDLHMNEKRVAKIDEDRLDAMDAGIYYKVVTLYAMRRNFDTHCYNLVLVKHRYRILWVTK